MFFYLYAYHSTNAGKGWKAAIVTWWQEFKRSSKFRKLFALAFITSMILFRTLLNRNLWLNPLSIKGGWGIWETVNGERTLTTECIENVIMMVPFSAVVAWTFQEKVGHGWKKILWQSGKIAFSFSVSIEMLQLLLRLRLLQKTSAFPFLPTRAFDGWNAGHSFLKNNSRTPNLNLIQSNRKLPTGSSIFLKKVI